MAKLEHSINLGIIGLSDGNGHPYSWSAIINGYDDQYIKNCPFPVIYDYLVKERYPDNFLTTEACVTHVWTQDIEVSKLIAKTARIKNVAYTMEEMSEHVDAVLLARDDAENHLSMALPFIKSGLPVFIDKPLALSVDLAKQILESQQYENQIFSCSSLRYAEEIVLSPDELEDIGEIRHVEATTPKSWDKYAVHIIEPIIKQFPNRGNLLTVKTERFNNEIYNCFVKWENITGHFKVTGKYPTPITFVFYGEHRSVEKAFTNSFSCFKKSLSEFIKMVKLKNSYQNIPAEETLETIKIIELGRL